MLYRFNTEYGEVSITKAVITKIIIEAVDRFEGKVFISNPRGRVVTGLFSKIGYFDESSNIEINMGSRGLDVRIFIVVRFGTSIAKVTNQLIDEIQNTIKSFTTVEPNSVAVVVAGTLSQQLTRRYIEVKRDRT
jgi:uncharacterized alkaline shock family protein YloU